MSVSANNGGYLEVDFPPPADGIYRIHYFYEENMRPPTMGTGIAAAGDFCVLLLVDHYKCWVATPTRWVRVGNSTDANHQYYGYLKMVLTSQGPEWRLEEEIVPHVRLDGCLVGFSHRLHPHMLQVKFSNNKYRCI
jgi:hypothetical protein